MTAETTSAFRLGVLTHAGSVGVDPGEHFARLRTFIEAAESLGFDGAWLAQHHFSPTIGAASPLALLANVAATTHRIQLGTAVSTLTLEDPVRLAEDAATVDALSGGRLQLGLGTGGANVPAFSAFGRDVADKDRLFAAHLTRLREALGGGVLAESTGTPGPGGGESVPLRLQPSGAALADRLWVSTGSPDRARQIGEQGDGLLLGTAFHDPRTVQRPLLDAYQEALGGAPGRVGVVRAIWPADTEQAALDEIAPAYAGGGWRADEERSVREIADSLNVHYGPVDRIVAGLHADPALLPEADWIIAVVDHQFAPIEDSIRRLQIIAERIAPALGWAASSAAPQLIGGRA